ncbi:MAG: winged helix-turn-helix domain-containing protein [Vulcanimicrobiaceae bacterium]
MRANSTEALILSFGTGTLQNAQLLEAAVTRVAEIGSDVTTIVVCPSPVVLASLLAQRGLRAVVLPRAAGMPLLRELCEAGIIPVCEGGQNEAIALADTLRSSRVILYTDAESVMSADPARIAEAVAVTHASHLEMLELADGAGIVHDRAADDARTLGVAYEIRSVVENRGTVVHHDAYEDRANPITSITVSLGLAFVSVRSTHEDERRWREQRARMLAELAARGVSIQMLQYLPLRMRFVVESARLNAAQELAEALELSSHAITRCAKICVVGRGVRSTAGIFHGLFAALDDAHVLLLHFTDSNVTISLLVQEDDAVRAEQALHGVLVPDGGLATGTSIIFDEALSRVSVNGREVRLGARQTKLLAFFIDNVGRVVAPEEVAKRTFGGEGKEELAALRVHMHNLRKKIEDDPDNPRYILTIPNQGYLFVR